MTFGDLWRSLGRLGRDLEDRLPIPPAHDWLTVRIRGVGGFRAVRFVREPGERFFEPAATALVFRRTLPPLELLEMWELASEAELVRGNELWRSGPHLSRARLVRAIRAYLHELVDAEVAPSNPRAVWTTRRVPL